MQKLFVIFHGSKTMVPTITLDAAAGVDCISSARETVERGGRGDERNLPTHTHTRRCAVPTDHYTKVHRRPLNENHGRRHQGGLSIASLGRRRRNAQKTKQDLRAKKAPSHFAWNKITR